MSQEPVKKTVTNVGTIVRENIQMKADIKTFIEVMSEVFQSFGLAPEEMGENPNMMAMMGKLTKKIAQAEMKGEDIGSGAMAKLKALQPIIERYKDKSAEILNV